MRDTFDLDGYVKMNSAYVTAVFLYEARVRATRSVMGNLTCTVLAHKSRETMGIVP